MQLAHHEQQVVRQPGVIEAARQLLGAAAVALVEADDVPAGGPRLVGNAAHVVREARPFETVQQDERPAHRAVRVPMMAMREDARVVRDVEAPLNGRRKVSEE